MGTTPRESLSQSDPAQREKPHHRVNALRLSAQLTGEQPALDVLKRMAYGFRDQDFFCLRILCLHQTCFQLTGA